MYKTVRHGENSLQYKILAQQEEGVPSVRRRKSPKAVTAKLIAVFTLLVVGIIASAVLVPLVLTNDFIALTGTFQKFSVSTLRRSHSGNHVVVIAKKPYGWNALHPSVSPRPPTRAYDVKKLSVETQSPEAANEPTETTHTEAETTPVTEPLVKETPVRIRKNQQTTVQPDTRTTSGSSAKPVKSWPTAPFIQQQKGAREADRVSSTAEPVWFEPVKKWGFQSSDSFISGMSGVVTNSVSIIASFLFVVVVVIMFFILRKTMSRGRTLTEKEKADSKEDKTRLLKPSVSSDHEEE